MSKNNKLTEVKVKTRSPAKPKGAVALGRKRDPALESNILEAAIDTLAELGFDNMTMDSVAAKAKTGKASMYRRWPSKGELVRDAIVWMSHRSVMVDKVPDTGSLREDLLSLLRPYDIAHSERKLKVLSKLGSFFTEHQKLADEAIQQIYGPWIEMNLKLMKRAAERKEISPAGDFKLACEVIVAMTSYSVQVQRKTFAKKDYEHLLDKVLLPALKAKS